jgi:acyl-CoA synthetase (AMP-forming)/AMP-acid ligase II
MGELEIVSRSLGFVEICFTDTLVLNRCQPQIPNLPYPTLVDLVCDRAQERPQHTAYIFLKDGEAQVRHLTYQELDRQARAIAVHLRSQVSCGDRALLIYPYDAGLEFIAAFLGCLYAGVIAVPSHPPRNRYAVSELSARLASSEAAIILTTRSLHHKLKRQLADQGDNSPTSAIPWLVAETIPHTHASDWVKPQITPYTVAFLQYTSGSTGHPKGVTITHNAILYNQQILKQAFGHTQDSIGVGWLPLFHDMGLIGNVLQALYLGTSCVLMSPIAFIRKPVRWLEAISRYSATTSGGPNFAYDLLCRQVSDSQLEQLDLSSWGLAFSGAEPIRAETIERFAAKFAPCGFRREAFYPCYGIAEATLFVTGGSKSDPPRVKYVEEAALENNQVVFSSSQGSRVRPMVSCGQPWGDNLVVIADPEALTRCLPNQVGEIWVSGAGVSSGYWNQPEETERTFHAYLKDTGEGPFLRTGDLGFLQGGELFITGRLDDVLVFWGLNHYPQQLEQTVERCHPAFRPNEAAAFSVPVNGEERLVIAQEVERSYRRHMSARAIVETARWAIFREHLIDVYAIALLKPGGLPKTSSGKIQRHKCQSQFLNGSLEVLDEWRAPQDEPSDIVSLVERYFNPITHLKRYCALVRGRLIWLWVVAKSWNSQR